MDPPIQRSSDKCSQVTARPEALGRAAHSGGRTKAAVTAQVVMRTGPCSLGSFGEMNVRGMLAGV